MAVKNLLPGLADNKVWLLSADKDEYTDRSAYLSFFAALGGPGNKHLRFAGGHILPPDYVEQLRDWF
ncbi:hypothetical protein [Paucibacter sp. M5-1]|uniref:hypothetical protein n=1 Tax=Paucibacter sp. M5-1 TaxID=3015998 RepID=UPI0022B933E4|nr:hypothetical protein [Paucibacter sp. M5-1]MCZ7880991.1 hypothetical protein [Paucibacter sp. M5-1]